MDYTRKKQLTLLLVILVLSSLSCNLLNRVSNAPSEPTPIPVSIESANSLRKEITSAAESLSAGERVTIVIDEAEITSLIAMELAKQSEPILYEPQVYLRDGEMQLNGKVLQSGFMVPAQMNLTMSTDVHGKPEINILSANVGPLDLPDSMLVELEGQIDTVFIRNIQSSINDVYVESIIIADGLMTIIGQTR